MKKLFVLLVAALMAVPCVVSAKSPKAFGWNLYSTKQQSAGFDKKGNLALASKKDKELLSWADSYTMLPEEMLEGNWKITSRVAVKKLSDESRFGIVFDLDQDLNSCAFLLNESGFKCGIFNNGTLVAGHTRFFNLKKQKNKAFELALERVGERYVFWVCGKKVFEFNRPVSMPLFGFYVDNGNSITVQSISFEGENVPEALLDIKQVVVEEPVVEEPVVEEPVVEEPVVEEPVAEEPVVEAIVEKVVEETVVDQVAVGGIIGGIIEKVVAQDAAAEVEVTAAEEVSDGEIVIVE